MKTRLLIELSLIKDLKTLLSVKLLSQGLRPIRNKFSLKVEILTMVQYWAIYHGKEQK